MEPEITIKELKMILNKFNDSDIVKVQVGSNVLNIGKTTYKNNCLVLKTIDNK